ncbi:MAG TPA: serine/threonine-protein kinase [Vicinamibacterales bacterium]
MTAPGSTGSGTFPGGTGGTRQLPARIAHFRILDRIGRGAMGVVYSARDERSGRLVAVKVMTADLEGDRETRERFVREARVAGQLLHRNVINVFEMGEEDGRLFMVMELLDGEPLNDHMRRVGQLSLEQALDLMMQTCEGLAVAHAHGIVHRDIKPGNLFLQRDGGLKILDFGVARLANSSMTASGFIVGTPDFMSPEQARGREIDQRSDVFSAGAVFYYMLSGAKPFAAADLPAVLHKVTSEPPPPLPPAQCPPALWRVLMRALEKNTADRYRDMGALLADLVRFQQEVDRETRGLAVATRERAAVVARLADEHAALTGAAGPVSPFSDELLDRYPVLEDRGPAALGVVPFRRAALNDIAADLDARERTLTAALARLRGSGARS